MIAYELKILIGEEWQYVETFSKKKDAIIVAHSLITHVNVSAYLITELKT